MSHGRTDGVDPRRWLGKVADGLPVRVERDDRTPAGEIEQELRCTRCGQVLGPSDVHYEQTAAR